MFIVVTSHVSCIYLKPSSDAIVKKSETIAFTNAPICVNKFACYFGEPYGLAAQTADLRSNNTTGRLVTIKV